MRRSWRAWLSNDDRGLGPWWVAYVWTTVFATGCAIGFTFITIAFNTGHSMGLPHWWGWFVANMTISLSITLSVRLLHAASARVIGRERLRGWSKARHSVYYTLVPIVGVSIGWPLGMLWAFGVDLRSLFSFERPDALIGSIALALLITTIFQQFFAMKTRQIQAENQATEAQLRLLQPQIEPHFLFNTLANVVSLMDADPPRAKAMLESFVDYLRASLAGLGHGTHTLSDEIDLVDAYLKIIKNARGRPPALRHRRAGRASRTAAACAQPATPGGERDRARPRAADRRRHPSLEHRQPRPPRRHAP